MNKVLGIVVLILISLVGTIYFSNKQMVPQPSASNKSTTADFTDISAYFAIFTNGTFRIFTAAMYHNLSQDIYIEEINPNVIQIKKDGLTWDDFFSTLPFKLTHKCLTTGTGQTFCTGSNGTLKFYINGVKNVNALDRQIKDGDKLLVTFGNESEMAIQKQLDKMLN